MNSNAHSAKPTTVAARPQRLGAFLALLLSLTLAPAGGFADQWAPAPAQPAAAQPGTEQPAAAQQQVPSLSPEAAAQVDALGDKLEALGPQATPEQLNAARQQFFSENNIAPQDADKLSQVLAAQQSADAQALNSDAAAEAEAVFHLSLIHI